MDPSIKSVSPSVVGTLLTVYFCIAHKNEVTLILLIKSIIEVIIMNFLSHFSYILSQTKKSSEEKSVEFFFKIIIKFLFNFFFFFIQ